MIDIIEKAYVGAASYLWKSLQHPFDQGKLLYFFFGISLLVWLLEIIVPWRKEQQPIRKGFWQDAFYLLFNFSLFNLLLYAALSSVTLTLFRDAVESIGLPRKFIIDMSKSALWVQFATFFVISDFIQWCVHNTLHRVPFLWRFHRLHHSVQEMGFAAHFRFHFVETFVYRLALFTMLSYVLNFKLEYAFYLHAFTILIGHLNHANLGWSYGPLKYLLNNPKMHIWHHAKELPHSHSKGMNFGLTLSIWDYLFGTVYIPKDGRDIQLGFQGIEKYPSNFFHQMIEPFKRK